MQGESEKQLRLRNENQLWTQTKVDTISIQYDIVFGDTKKEKEEEEVTEELNISNNSEEGGRSPPEINNKSQENSSP